MIENYLKILEESLQKKIAVLDEISAYNEEQKELLSEEVISMEAVDANMQKKDALVQKILDLDDGFETLYDRVREQLMGNTALYKLQIKRLQDLISIVTEKSVSIQAQEARNKKLVENYFAKERSSIGRGRQASKAAYDYYRNMNNTNVVPAQIMDQKK